MLRALEVEPENRFRWVTGLARWNDAILANCPDRLSIDHRQANASEVDFFDGSSLRLGVCSVAQRWGNYDPGGGRRLCRQRSVPGLTGTSASPMARWCRTTSFPSTSAEFCDGPETRRHLIDTVKTESYSDIFIFSHGWNNDWTVATGRYEHFMNGYMKMRSDHALPMPASYRPLLVGVFWPSTALVFTEEEKGPQIAAGNPEAVDEAVAEERRQLRELADEMSVDDARRFYELMQKGELTTEEALELARIARPIYHETDEELQVGAPITEEEIVTLWAAASPKPPNELDDFGTVGGAAAGAAPQAAGLGDLVRRLDPRNVLRTLTVYQMKDRAGTVGAQGVGPLLRDLLSAGNARVHMIGHSYGGKVVLSAVSFGGDLPRKVTSILLLQPAVSHLCFADRGPEDRPTWGLPHRPGQGRKADPHHLQRP